MSRSEFYGPVNTVKVISSWSVNILTLFPGQDYPPCSQLELVQILSPVTVTTLQQLEKVFDDHFFISP